MSAHAHRTKNTATPSSRPPPKSATRAAGEPATGPATGAVDAPAATPMLDAAEDMRGHDAAGDPELVGHNGFNAHQLPGGTPQTQAYGRGGGQRSFQTPNNLGFFDIYGGMSGHMARAGEQQAWSKAGKPERDYEGPTWIDAGQAPGQDRLTPEVRGRREGLDQQMQDRFEPRRRCPDDLVDEARSYRQRRHPPAVEAHFEQLLADANEFFSEVNHARLDGFWGEYRGNDGGERYSTDTLGLSGRRTDEQLYHGSGYRGEFQYVGTETRSGREKIRSDREQAEIDYNERFPERNAEVDRKMLGPSELDQGDASYLFDYLRELNGTLPDLQTHTRRFDECFSAGQELIDHYEVVKDSNGLRLFIPILGLQADAEPEMRREMYISGHAPQETFYLGPRSGETTADSAMTEINYKQHTREIIRRAMAFDEFKRTIDAWVARREEVIDALEPFLLTVKQVSKTQNQP